ncbi:DNA mismatch repair protein MutS [Muricauda sp. SCSIO 64092]|uniref:MutS-related protein n=1 Tax=Allomuricauda sp. SCSIO 64092 TaxID=2908842 RepID=UPI001FF64769|nr:DNA mismatch repair protein MutS [Muricauda sp. SCSIO 64092]UOY08671.1 DNA mismatch repair protein MutS [Muricauda sp. SCSIO 64092]
MNDPQAFYKKQLVEHGKSLTALKTKLNASSVLRLVLFLGIISAIYLSWSQTNVLLGILVFAIPLFVLLVVRHQKLKYQRDVIQNLQLQNKRELNVLNHEYYGLPDGKGYQDATHAFSQDIDLFGRGSFFQYCNRTALKSGSDLLAATMLSNDINNIVQKQEAIQELSKIPEWRQHFTAVGSLVRTEVDSDTVVRWLGGYRPFVPSAMHGMSIGFSLLSLLVWASYFLGYVSGYAVFGVFLLGLAITGAFLPKINQLSAQTTKAQSTLRQYAKLLQLLEQHKFASEVLKSRRNAVATEGNSSSSILKKFSRVLDALDQRNNLIIGILGNGFLLRDLFVSKSIEDWISSYKEQIPKWFATIAFFDAYNSLGNYAFNHPNHSFPKIEESNYVLRSKAAAHPLLKVDVAVANPISIAKEEFFIITGANMAGKSTFLRTVGLQLVMANMGLPVCAEQASYSPIKLITSMRTTDSLTNDESYFFSELKRLKYIIDTIAEEPYFIILDEILKGTNSTDKAAGSKKFIERLVGLRTTGLIATHDLSLCEVADSLKTVKNYYFDAQIVNDELFFDYTFKEGVCENMNASFLLHKMGIVD